MNPFQFFSSSRDAAAARARALQGQESCGSRANSSFSKTAGSSRQPSRDSAGSSTANVVENYNYEMAAAAPVHGARGGGRGQFRPPLQGIFQLRDNYHCIGVSWV